LGYRGKIEEQNRARDLRAEGYTMPEIAEMLGVSRSSVSLWVRDVAYTARRARPSPTGSGAGSRHPMHLAKVREIAQLNAAARERVGSLDERNFLLTGIALYAAEGGKTDGAVSFPNSDPTILVFFCRWLRYFFDVDEARLRITLYLHVGLDLDAAESYWSELLSIPRSQFTKPYRAEPNPSIRTAKHIYGCPRVSYACSRTHRSIMGLCRALLSCEAVPSGVAQLAEQGIVNPKAVGSSPTPGAHRG
jgi:predicted transcriptional regulator